jgi:Holliday junction resolvase-like predicted endonuclease
MKLSNVGIWTVTSGDPHRLQAGALELEKQLEDWIEKDPSLIDPGLTIVGRQLHLEAGPIDLLAIDPQGRWVVIEIKRGQLRRDAVCQAIDYAACLEKTPYEELAAKTNNYLASRRAGSKITIEDILRKRPMASKGEEEDIETIIYLVGTGEDPGLMRMGEYLGRRNVAVRVVLVDTYQLPDGSRLLVRELTESDTPLSSAEKAGARYTMDRILTRAKSNGLDKHMQLLIDAAARHGLQPRPYKESIAFTPPTNRTRTLFVAWSGSSLPGSVYLWVGPEVFAEFFPITAEDTVSIMGKTEYRSLNLEQVGDFTKSLDRLFEKIKEAK